MIEILNATANVAINFSINQELEYCLVKSANALTASPTLYRFAPNPGLRAILRQKVYERNENKEEKRW